MRTPLDGVVVITGASSGIGREMARIIATEATKVILIARRRERLDVLASELVAARADLEIAVCPCDLSDLVATDALATKLLTEHGPIDVLINNAGLGDIGLFEASDWTRIALMNRVNIDALTLLTHRLLPAMIERGRGGILNVSSGFGLTIMPVMSAYVASKHYVSAFTESLRLELAGTDVVVSQVCPGPVDTEFEDLAGNPFGRSPPKLLVLSPEACARAAIVGFRRGRALITPGFLMKIVMAAGRLTPLWVYRILYRWIGPYTRGGSFNREETVR